MQNMTSEFSKNESWILLTLWQEFILDKQLTLPSFRKDFKVSTHYVSRQIKVKQSLVCAFSAILMFLNWKKAKKKRKKGSQFVTDILSKKLLEFYFWQVHKPLVCIEACPPYLPIPVKTCQPNQIKEIILEGVVLERVKVHTAGWDTIFSHIYLLER